MRKTLILLTASYPFGKGETFVAGEMPYLAAEFDDVVIVTNDTTTLEARPLPASTRVVRHTYALGRLEKVKSLTGLLSPAVWEEVGWARRHRRLLAPGTLATILVSWFKARKFAGIIRGLVAPGTPSEVHVYSYWANDMAVAAAVARGRGWASRAYCRAHGWDVYMDRTGYLPFRHKLATELDHYLFVSQQGVRYFEALMGRSYPSVACARLGTPGVSDGPVSRSRPFTIVSCSALIPLKRVALIAESIRHVSTAMEWVHFGDGPDRAKVEARCAELPDHVRVTLRGSVPNEEVLEEYRRLRPSLFLNLSSTEGLPVSMMEAMSAGIPVMGPDVGGVSEIVSDGENGALLAANPTPEEVAAAIDAFADMDETTFHRYARSAWHRWNTAFNADRNYPAFLQVVLGPTL